VWQAVENPVEARLAKLYFVSTCICTVYLLHNSANISYFNNGYITGWFRRTCHYFGSYIIGHCKKKSSYGQVSNSKWLSACSCLNLQTSLRFVFVRLDKERSLPYKMYPRSELLVRILGAAARIKKRKDQLTTNSTRTSHTICNVD